MIGRRDLGTGTLLNLTSGGDGVRNRIIPEEECKQRSIRTAGINNPMYNKNHTTETKKYISVTRREKIKNGEITPTKHSKEWREELRRNNAGGKATSKPVVQIDLFGNIVKYWPSAFSAQRALGIGRGKIRSAILNEWQIPGGYYWRNPNNTYVDISACLEEREKQHSPIRNFRTINQYSLDGEFIKTWSTISMAARDLNSSLDLLARIRKGNRQPELGGFIWKK